MSTDVKDQDDDAVNDQDNQTQIITTVQDDPDSSEHMLSKDHVSSSDDAIDEGLEVLVELPRDILTAYILCQLTGKWKEYTFTTKFCIWFGLYGSYLIQFAVFFSFIADLDFSYLDSSGSQETWWFNMITISVLFMYLWRDIIQFYNSVWWWIGKVESAKNFKTFSKVTNIRNVKRIHKIGSKIGKQAKRVKDRDFDMKRVWEGAKFWQYRMFLLAVGVLYIGFALYSLVAIGNTVNIEGNVLIAKLSVAVQIFFVLEVDNWANDLFIIQTGILDDEEFDVRIVLKGETEVDGQKRTQRRLVTTSVILGASILVVSLLSNFKNV